VPIDGLEIRCSECGARAQHWETTPVPGQKETLTSNQRIEESGNG
jgi:hypothetical protein